MSARLDGERIGPGALVLVVGPSGAGKDTLINLVRARCFERPAIVFPRRIVTRAASDHEDHDCMTEAEFTQAVAAGAFALSWQAHGLSYGVPAAINDDLRLGRTVVCNVSRTVVAEARLRYARCAIILVTAPEEVLVERLMRRNRLSDGDAAGRLGRRAPPVDILMPDLVIENVENPDTGSARLERFIEFHARSDA